MRTLLFLASSASAQDVLGCVTPEVVRRLSPYLNRHLKQFGPYVLDMTIQPEPLELKTLFGLRV